MNALCPPTDREFAAALRHVNSATASPEQRAAAVATMEARRDALVRGGTRRLTAAELRDRNVLAMRPARFANLRRPKTVHVGFPIFSVLIFGWLFALSTAACVLATFLVIWSFQHFGHRAVVTADQAALPEFREWDGSNLKETLK